MKYHNNAFLAQGSQKNILYGYQGQRVVIFYNCCKYMEDYISFQVLKSLKDGTFFVQKYLKGFGTPHGIVLTDVPPNVDKCSLDRERWEITQLGYTEVDVNITRSIRQHRIVQESIEVNKNKIRKTICDEG